MGVAMWQTTRLSSQNPNTSPMLFGRYVLLRQLRLMAPPGLLVWAVRP